MNLSLCEARYISLSLAAFLGVWLLQLVKELTGQSLKLPKLFVIKSAIDLAKNPAFHSRSKHITIRCHYFRTGAQECSVEVHHIPMDEQRVDMRTKCLGRVKFSHFCELIAWLMSESNPKIKGEIVRVDLMRIRS